MENQVINGITKILLAVEPQPKRDYSLMQRDMRGWFIKAE
jgi:hypothetical protein